MGDTTFVLASDGGNVVASVAMVSRKARYGSKTRTSLYGCDYKVAPSHRGTGLARALALHATKRFFTGGHLAATRLVYAAAMRGDRGDVMRSVRQKVHPAHLFRAAAQLSLYFEDPETLAGLDLQNSPAPPNLRRGLDLSPSDYDTPRITNTAGRKDLRLVSAGEPWRLLHLGQGPEHWTPTWGHYLTSCAKAAATDVPAAQLCFGIDNRLSDHIGWLDRQNIRPGATCTIYLLRAPWLLPRAEWIHLSTAEI